MSAVVLPFLVLILALDVLASLCVVRSHLISPSQKVAWLAFAWLMPLLGPILALHVSSDGSRPAPMSGSYGVEGGAADGELWMSGDCTGGGHGGDGGCGDGGGH